MAASWTGKLLFVFLSMLVMGVLSVLEWDALTLDYRDQSILTALPLRPRTVFAAKFWALAQFMRIFAVDVNAGSIVMLPPIEMMGIPHAGFLTLARYAFAHAAGTIGAGVFTFLFVVSVQATLINIFKPRWFRRISTVMQVAGILTLLAALFFFPAVMGQLPDWKLHTSAMFRWFPPMWFVGWCEVLEGAADPQFHLLARMGLGAIAAAGASAVIAYGLAFGRYTRSSLEIPAKPGGQRARWRQRSRSSGEALLEWFVPDPLERATFRFTLKTMIRSPKHRLILAAYAGTALAIVLEEILTSSLSSGGAWRQARQMGLVSLPLVISFFLLSGMRFVFNIPSELPANWIFQITEGAGKHAYLAGVRKSMSLAVVAPLAILALPIYTFLFGPATGVLHIAYCSLWSLIMIELLLWRFEKVPFACSYSPGKVPVVALLCGYFLAFMAYTDLLAWMETYLLQERLAAVTCVSLLSGALWALIAYRARTSRETSALLFLEEPEPVVQTLDLWA